MKIAAVSEDGTTISEHFGRAPMYVVVTIEDGAIVGQEQRIKTESCQGSHGHHDHDHDHDHHHHTHDANHTQQDSGQPKQESQSCHNRLIKPITDCEVVLARGMGRGAYQKVESSGIRPILTDILTIDDAVLAYVEGRIVNHVEQLH